MRFLHLLLTNLTTVAYLQPREFPTRNNHRHQGVTSLTYKHAKPALETAAAFLLTPVLLLWVILACHHKAYHQPRDSVHKPCVRVSDGFYHFLTGNALRFARDNAAPHGNE